MEPTAGELMAPDTPPRRLDPLEDRPAVRILCNTITNEAVVVPYHLTERVRITQVAAPVSRTRLLLLLLLVCAHAQQVRGLFTMDWKPVELSQMQSIIDSMARNEFQDDNESRVIVFVFWGARDASDTDPLLR
jgi:hypothetical protein